jgi:hypothetical protein
MVQRTTLIGIKLKKAMLPSFEPKIFETKGKLLTTTP